MANIPDDLLECLGRIDQTYPGEDLHEVPEWFLRVQGVIDEAHPEELFHRRCIAGNNVADNNLSRPNTVASLPDYSSLEPSPPDYSSLEPSPPTHSPFFSPTFSLTRPSIRTPSPSSTCSPTCPLTSSPSIRTPNPSPTFTESSDQSFKTAETSLEPRPMDPNYRRRDACVLFQSASEADESHTNANGTTSNRQSPSRFYCGHAPEDVHAEFLEWVENERGPIVIVDETGTPIYRTEEHEEDTDADHPEETVERLS